MQIVNSSLAQAKDRMKSLRGPWYSQNWHLFAPFLPEDLRPRNSRLALQLIGESETRGASRNVAKEGDAGMVGLDDPSDAAELVRQPRSIINGQMFPYQIEGLQWMVRQHAVGVGGILGDEMGLGKTLQASLV